MRKLIVLLILRQKFLYTSENITFIQI